MIGAGEERSKLLACILAADRVMVGANVCTIVDVNCNVYLFNAGMSLVKITKK